MTTRKEPGTTTLVDDVESRVVCSLCSCPPISIVLFFGETTKFDAHSFVRIKNHTKELEMSRSSSSLRQLLPVYDPGTSEYQNYFLFYSSIPICFLFNPQAMMEKTTTQKMQFFERSLMTGAKESIWKCQHDRTVKLRQSRRNLLHPSSTTTRRSQFQCPEVKMKGTYSSVMNDRNPKSC